MQIVKIPAKRGDQDVVVTATVVPSKFRNWLQVRLPDGTVTAVHKNLIIQEPHVTHTLQLVPAGWTALALYGDQLQAEIHNRYQGRMVSSHRPDFQGKRPWLALQLGDFLAAHPEIVDPVEDEQADDWDDQETGLPGVDAFDLLMDR